jgi:hypothetical protein
MIHNLSNTDRVAAVSCEEPEDENGTNGEVNVHINPEG